MPLDVGTAAPDFTLRNQDKEMISLSDLKGRRTLIVFIPFPHTGICDAESCQIRDNWSTFQDLDANVVVITAHAVAHNKAWAEQNGLQFDVLSDYWPHGEVAQAYDTFDHDHGNAKRTTYVLDADGVIRDVVASDVLGEARPFVYAEALSGV